MNKYNRPYCKNCNIVYSIIKNMGIRKCPKCNKDLIYKDFNPKKNLYFGIFLLISGLITVALKASPIILIGVIIWGLIKIATSYDEWEKIKKLDDF